MPDLAGICHICAKLAAKACRLCGRPTCKDHLKDGVCTACRSGTK